MESVKELEKRLLIAKKIEKIKTIFNNAHCPICGNKGLEEEVIINGAESMVYGCASVKCNHCDLFNYKHKINSYDAYHWNYDGSSELYVLQEILNKILPYINKE